MPSLWYGFIGCEKLTCVIWVCCVNMHVIVVTEPVSKLFGILWNCGRNNWGVYQRLIRCYCSVDTVASWFVSPVMSGAVSVLLFLICKYFILFEVCFHSLSLCYLNRADMAGGCGLYPASMVSVPAGTCMSHAVAAGRTSSQNCSRAAVKVVPH